METQNINEIIQYFCRDFMKKVVEMPAEFTLLKVTNR